MRRIAAIELHSAVSEAPAGLATTQVAVVCDADTAGLRVTDPLTSKSDERVVSLRETVASARARLIALAIAELVSASWSELVTNPTPRVPPVPPPPPEPVREPARRIVAPLPFASQVLGDGRVLSTGDLVLGAGVRVEPWLTPDALLRFDAFVHRADLERTIGTVTLETVDAALGAGLSRELAPWLRGVGSAALRAGWAQMVGYPGAAAVIGHPLSGISLGPELTIALDFFPHARIHPVLSLTAGWTALGIDGRVTGDRDVTVKGVWGALDVGCAIE